MRVNNGLNLSNSLSRFSPYKQKLTRNNVKIAMNTAIFSQSICLRVKI